MYCREGSLPYRALDAFLPSLYIPDLHAEEQQQDLNSTSGVVQPCVPLCFGYYSYCSLQASRVVQS